MRLFLLLGVLALSTQAFATGITVGDKIHRVGFLAMTGIAVPMTEDKEIVQYNASNGQYLVRTTTAVPGGTPSAKDEWLDSSKILSHEQTTQLLTQCAALGGKNETVTAAGKTFNACAIPLTSAECAGTLWFGEVPFGNIKMDISCPGQGVQQLEMPTAPEKGGEISFSWGS